MYDQVTKHDWVIDFDDDNGKYLHVCTECGKRYFGHKRRVGDCCSCWISWARNFIAETRKSDPNWLNSLVFDKEIP